MAKKTIDSKVWKDNFFSVLTPKQKLLWLYLITCDFNNMLGIYEINLRIVSFDTGLSLDEINDYLALFESKGKIVVKGDYLNLVNFLKHQNYNPNMKKSALNVYQDLPDEMKIEGYDYFDDFDDMVKAFGFANKVLEVKKPNTKNELFNEFYLKYNKIGRRLFLCCKNAFFSVPRSFLTIRKNCGIGPMANSCTPKIDDIAVSRSLVLAFR